MDFPGSRLSTTEDDLSLTSTEIRPEPPFDVIMKVRLAEFVEEERDTNPIKSLGDVDSDNRRTMRGFWPLQTVGDLRDEREKGRCR